MFLGVFGMQLSENGGGDAVGSGDVTEQVHNNVE